MGSNYFFSLDALKPQESGIGGNLTFVTGKEVPGLVNMSFSKLKLNKQGFQDPIWHPNANKIGYCLQGKALVSMRSPSATEVFNVEEGDVFFIPQGHVHHLANLGEKETTLIFALNHTQPQTMRLSSAIHSLSNEVFTATFNTPLDFVEGLKKSKKRELLSNLPSQSGQRFISSRFKFNISASPKPVLTKGGYLQLATKTNLPVLDGLGILGFGLNSKGVVEPHWHTNAGELVYIVKGKTRITLLSPDGSVEAVEVNEGQGIFAPASYFHNIENIGEEAVEVIAFFSHAEPDYIGIGEVMGSLENQALGSIFNVPASYFDSFKKPTGPLVIVPIAEPAYAMH